MQNMPGKADCAKHADVNTLTRQGLVSSTFFRCLSLFLRCGAIAVIRREDRWIVVCKHFDGFDYIILDRRADFVGRNNWIEALRFRIQESIDITKAEK